MKSFFRFLGLIFASGMALSAFAQTPPAISSQPQSTVVTAGQTLSLSVVATGTAPLTFQWRRDGVAISGATAATFTTATPTPGRFSVVITNAAGSVTSADSLVAVNTAGAGLTDWRIQAANGVLNDLAFNGATGVAVGENGAMLRTLDGGSTWTAVTSGVTDTLFSVRHAGSGVFYAVGWSWGSRGVALKSGDNGATWQTILVKNGGFNELFGVWTDGPQTVVIGGTNQILKSTNGGTSFATATYPSGYRYGFENFAGRLVGLVHASGNIAFQTSTNSGDTWTDAPGQPGTDKLRDFAIVGNRLVAVGYDGKVAVSTDGQNFQLLPAPNSYQYWAATEFGGRLFAGQASAVEIIDPVSAATTRVVDLTGQVYGLSRSANRVFFLGQGYIASAADSSRPPTAWTALTSPTTKTFNKVLYANGTFLAAGNGDVNAGSGSVVLRSADGLAWDKVYENTSSPFFAGCGVAYATGGWVVGGNWGKSLSSSDGTNWTVRNVPIADPMNGVVANGASVVAACNVGNILFSSDSGATWASRSSGTSNGLGGTAYGNGLYVVSGAGGTILTSPDGTTWTARNSGTSQGIWGIAYANARFVAVGQGGTIVTSPDGITWSVRASGVTTDLNAVTYGAGLWVVVGSNGKVLYSADTSRWLAAHSGMTHNLGSVSFGSGRFVVVGEGGKINTLTPGERGLIWGGMTSGLSGPGFAVGFYNGLFVAGWSDAGSGGGIATSTDGVTWTLRQTVSGAGLYSVAYGNGRYVVGSNWGRVYSSADGVTWTLGSYGDASPLGVTYFGGKFIGTAGDGTTRYTSTDGVTWTRIATGNGMGGSYATDGNTLVCGGYGTLQWSTDGITWNNPTTSLPTGVFYHVAYGGGVFAVNDNTGRIYSSTDGKIWQARVSPITVDSVLTYGAGRFLGVGTGGVIYESLDGATWTLDASGTTTDLARVAYGNGRFVATTVDGGLLVSNAVVNQTPAPDLNAGLVAYYPFSGNATDTSGSGRNGVVNGATLTTDRFGNANSAFLFGPSSAPANTSYISTNQNLGVAGNSARTVSVWFRVDSTPDYPAGSLISWGSNSAGQVFSVAYEPWSQYDSVGSSNLLLGAGNLRFVVNAGNIKYGGYSSSNLALGQWNNLVVTYQNRLAESAIYLNGVRLPGRYVTPAEAGWSSSNDNTTLGTTDTGLFINSYLGLGYGIAGAIDDVRIYNRALSGDEVAALYGAESAFSNLVPQTLTFNPPATKTYGDSSFAVSATSDSGLPVSVTVVSGPATISGGMVTLTGAGTVVLRASQAGDATRAAATLDKAIAVAPRPLTVTAAAKTKVYGTVDPALTYTLTSGSLVGSDQLSGALSRVAGETVAGGPYAITQGTATAGPNYALTFVGANLTITKASQTITFNALPAKAATDPAFALSASSSSGGAVTFTSSNTAVATVSGNTVTLIAAGSTNIVAKQAGDANYNAAPDVTQVLTVASGATTPVRSVTATVLNNSLAVPAGQTGQVAINLTTTTGDVSGIAFTIEFDPAVLEYAARANGADLGMATVTPNVLNRASGKIAFIISFNTPDDLTGNLPTFAVGSKQLLVLTFKVLAASVGTTAVRFADSIATRQSSSAVGTPLAVTFVDNTSVAVGAPTVIAPSITSQPQSQTATTSGGTVTFNATAAGSPAPALQWFFNGSAISGATNATLTLNNVQAIAAGNYWVVATNSAGSVKSSVATFSLTQPGNSATQAVVGAGYTAGQALTLTNTLTYSGTASALSWSALLPAGWSFASAAGSAGDQGPAVGTTDVLEWAWTNIPASPVTFTYTVNVPATASGAQEVVALAGVRNGTSLQFLAQPDPLVVPQVTTHSADSDQNFRLSLLELTRVIELYNTRSGSTRTGCYAVATAATEDGFTTDPTRGSTTAVTLARYHSADSNRDGKLSLLELTRVIELYNYRSGTTRTGQYHAQVGTEDGFAPGP